ncbi:MAG: hypothetical protein M3O03_11640 [Pseudomonadota bacterium]|nr:hypothetical protein [Pseudomonadota bacterium]
MTNPTRESALKALDAMADVVLAYRPKPKTKPAKKRKRLAKKLAAKTGKDQRSFTAAPDKSAN